MNFEFLVLGTGSATPVVNRHPSAFLLSIENESFLIDCGEGTQYRLLENKIKSSRIRHIFISHLHGDHYFGLIGLLSSWNLNQRKEELTIFAPRGLDEILTTQFKYSDTRLHFKIIFVETNTESINQILDTNLVTVETIPLQHRIPCCGFLFRSKASKRKIVADKLPSNFPIPYMKMLKDGLDIFDELTGVTYKNKDFTVPGGQSKSFAYCSDTAFNELKVNQIQGIDTIYHEATFTESEAKRAEQTNHSTAKQAAKIAQMSNAKQLIIGHYSSRYKTLETHLEEAKSVFANTLLAEENTTYKV
ncbi:Ribonuclease Z [Emticicia oligotrophica DSM 17448]|uniref:Ribonuclease Z n=1 Tax=Emticicia oligotrophica (strain DSM 17448 / CIP 109782 / MTCC 6937 / GPTSA100-15) TaxID=929562 RepID=A0ABM5N6H7_EMTOG|nr:ribonuclease Z [Emticicia oligotrophica]AFK05070.1 Ribonuclease Z [Emticicia oligotrophica DSM 17448]